MIKDIIANAFEDCNDTNVFLRGNTYITKLLTSYTKRQSGRWHLVRALKDACKEMVALDELNLEMDPQKIYASATDEEKELFGSNYQENSKMQEILRIHSVELAKWCDRFLNDIFTALSAMPFGIRWLGKALIVMAESKFPE